MTPEPARVFGYARALRGTVNRSDAEWVRREGTRRGPFRMFRDDQVASWSGFEDLQAAWSATPGAKTLVVPTIEHLGAGDLVRGERFVAGAARANRERAGYLVTRRIEGDWTELEPTLIAVHHAMLTRRRNRGRPEAGRS